MSSAFKDMCLELVDEPEKLAKFIKLYYDEDDEKVYSVRCQFCNKELEKINFDEEYNYCSDYCKIFNTLVHGSYDKIKEIFNSIEKIHIFTDDFDKIKRETLISLLSDKDIKYRNQLVDKITYYSDYSYRHKEPDLWYFPLLTLSDIEYISDNTHLLLKFIEVYTIPKIKEEGYIKILICKNHSKINSLLKPYLDKTDVIPCVNFHNEELCNYLIDRYEKSELKKSDLWKHLYKKSTFKLFYEYEEITDDIADYWTDQYIVPEYLINYIYSNPNRLFKKLKKENIDKFTNNKYSNNWHLGNYALFDFLSNNAQGIKTTITKDTMETFVMSMCSVHSEFNWLVGFLVANTLDSDIDINLNFYYTFESIKYSLNYMTCVCAHPNYLAFEKLYRLGSRPRPQNIFNLLFEFGLNEKYRLRGENASKILEFYGKTNSIKEGYAIYEKHNRYNKGIDKKLESLGITDYKNI